MSERKTAKATPQAIAAAVVAELAKLERDDFPRNGICHHLGVSTSCGTTAIGLSLRGRRLLVTLYDGVHGRSAATHRERADAVAKALKCGIIERWNGGHGAGGVSIVLGRWAPESLIQCIANYHRAADVFNFTRAERQAERAFDRWLNPPSRAKAA